MDTPELPESNRRRRPRKRRQEGIPRWLEMAVAVTALITSISSIVLAIGNGNAMDKLVKANSVPYLLGGFSDVTPEGSRILSLDLVNNGSAPPTRKACA